MEILKYILEKEVIDGEEELHLMRIVMYDVAGQQGEEYYDGKWHPFDGALSYLPDPFPGDFIDEQQAMEVIKQLT